jgi:hypothetical protein
VKDGATPAARSGPAVILPDDLDAGSAPVVLLTGHQAVVIAVHPLRHIGVSMCYEILGTIGPNGP